MVEMSNAEKMKASFVDHSKSAADEAQKIIVKLSESGIVVSPHDGVLLFNANLASIMSKTIAFETAALADKMSLQNAVLRELLQKIEGLEASIEELKRNIPKPPVEPGKSM